MTELAGTPGIAATTEAARAPRRFTLSGRTSRLGTTCRPGRQLAAYAWQVAALEPGRFFGLRGLTDLHVRRLDPAQPRPFAYIDGLWGFLLKELPGDRTRLVQSGYQSIRPRWLEHLINFWIHPPVHRTGQTRQFANLKRNIESAGRRQPQSRKR